MQCDEENVFKVKFKDGKKTEFYNNFCFTRFTDSLQNIRNRHIDTVPNMAQAVLRMNKNMRMQDGVTDTIQYFLDRLYTSRDRHYHI